LKLVDKKILIISPDDWGFLSLSKHYYAKELAKNNDVYFLNPKENEYKSDFESSNVTVITDYRTIPGISKLPLKFANSLMKLEVSSILKRIDGHEIDIVWSFDTSRLFNLKLFTAKFSISHIVDYTENFNFESLNQSADLCLSVVECVCDRMKLYNRNVFKIDHGCSSIVTADEIEFEIKERSHGVYVGNLNIKYIDWEAIFMLAYERSDIDFYFYGPLDEKYHLENVYYYKVLELNNVIFKGVIPSDEVKEVLAKASFCLVCYLYKEFGRQLDNSHKIMQYLGSGKPIFSSYTYEYRNKNLLCMYNDTTDLITKFNRFISDDSDYFKETRVSERLKYASENTYAMQIVKIESIINSTINKLED